jgi:hypothetical protein
MTIETVFAREEAESCRRAEQEYLCPDRNVLAIPNIRFDVSTSQRRPLDPSLDETVVNPVWSRGRVCDA